MASSKKTPRRVSTFRRFVASTWNKNRSRLNDFLARRPHRSFRRTRRRDYVRSLNVPGYWRLTGQVAALLWSNKRLFGSLVLLYGILTVVFVGIGSQEAYEQLKSALDASSGDIFSGGWGMIGEAGLLAVSAIGIDFSAPGAGDAQRIFGSMLIILVWLTSVWLLRAVMAGSAPKLRDGLYSAGAPIVSVTLLSLVLIVQMLPIGVGAIALAVATSYGLLEGGVVAMVFWLVIILLSCLSLYWLTSTLFALLVATLPGMYPWQALRTASDLVIGRRLRILYRFLWLGAVTLVVWAVVLIPVILFDSWVKSWAESIAWAPIVPVTASLLSILSVVWISAYTYVLYRKVVDDDAAPA